jgi:uncharacterized protein
MTTNFAAGTPNWVDIGTTDVPGATAFYTELFGWTAEDLGTDSGGYGFFRRNGKMVGGFGPATDPARGTSWAVYFATDDADQTASQVEANGGTVVAAPMDVMEQGRMAVFQDPAGAYFSVWQPGMHKGCEVVGEPGSLSWAELTSSDVTAAKDFYQAVLPVSAQDMDMGEGSTYTLLKVGGTSVAGAMTASPDNADKPAHWSVYFAVDDCDAVADKAIELGATEMMRQDSPAGRFAVLSDPQGGTFCLIQNNPDFSP